MPAPSCRGAVNNGDNEEKKSASHFSGVSLITAWNKGILIVPGAS